MARVFISFLGTNDYLPCTYFAKERNQQIEKVRFVQEANLQIYCQDWKGDDRILIFTTDDAYKKNWRDNGHVDKNGNTLSRMGLEKCISNLKLQPTVKRIPIPEGKSEREIWDIFDIVFEQLDEGDETVFDITHAFRSIPMLATVVLNYAKVMKNVTLRGIYYGAFEVLGSYHEVKNIPKEKRLAPIFDLTAFDLLMEWSLAIDRFLGSGDATPVCSLAKRELTPVLKSSRGRDSSALAIKKIANKLEAFTRAMTTCRGPEISDKTSSLKEAIVNCDNLDLIHAFQPLLNRIEEQIRPFKGDEVQDGIESAKWCLEHNLIQQGYTILEETLISFATRKANVDPLDNEKRGVAAAAITILNNNIPQNRWFMPASDYPELTKFYLNFFKSHRELVSMFRALSDFRNDLNYAGYRKNPKPSTSFKKKLGDLISKAEKQLK